MWREKPLPSYGLHGSNSSGQALLKGDLVTLQRDGRVMIRDSRGQAMVEAALTMLLLFMFIFAIWEAGRMLQVRQALTDAAREGARLSVAPLTQTLPGDLLSESNPARVQTFVQSYLEAASIHIPLSQITVVSPVNIGTTKYTKVTVTYDYRMMTLLIFGNYTMTLTGQSLMRNETSD